MSKMKKIDLNQHDTTSCVLDTYEQEFALLLIVGDKRKLYVWTDGVQHNYIACNTPFTLNSINNNYFDGGNTHFPYILGGFCEKQTKIKRIEYHERCVNAINLSNNNFDIKFANTTTIKFINNNIKNGKNNIFEYKTQKNDLKMINIPKGINLISFHIKNNELGHCIIIIGGCFGYYIYSITRDEWIFDKNNKKTFMDNQGRYLFNPTGANQQQGARALLFNQSLVFLIF